MSPTYKYLLIASLIILSNSEIEYGTCTDDKRTIKFEDGTIKTFDCLKCDSGFYTKYEDNELKCIKCPENSDNYGNDILIDIFTEKIFLNLIQNVIMMINYYVQFGKKIYFL